MSENKKSSNLSEGKGGGQKLIIAIGAVIIVLLVVVIVILLLKDRNSTGEEENREIRNTVITQENVDEVIEQMAQSEYVEPGYYKAQMATVWTFSKGDAISEDAFVRNDESNTNDVYFDLFLVDNENDPILKSPIIPRGAELNNISLDKPLDAGTYECILIYHLIDDNQDTVSTLRVQIKVIVEQ